MLSLLCNTSTVEVAAINLSSTCNIAPGWTDAHVNLYDELLCGQIIPCFCLCSKWCNITSVSSSIVNSSGDEMRWWQTVNLETILKSRAGHCGCHWCVWYQLLLDVVQPRQLYEYDDWLNKNRTLLQIFGGQTRTDGGSTPQSKQMDCFTILSLPVELYIEILKRVSAKEVCALVRTCKVRTMFVDMRDFYMINCFLSTSNWWQRNHTFGVHYLWYTWIRATLLTVEVLYHRIITATSSNVSCWQ